MIPETLTSLAVPLDGLRHYKRNPRRGDVEQIKASLERHGQYRPIVVNARTSEVLAGNHTLKAARELGWQEIAATFIDVDDDTAARIVLIDNRANDLAGYDPSELLAILRDLPDLAGTGYSDSDLAGMVAQRLPGEGGDTEPASVPDEPRTRPGDLWILGRHRLICGDATTITDVERLVGADRADCMWTDPPYGVSYVGGTKDRLTIQNDGSDGLEQLLTGAFACATVALKPGRPVYIAHPHGALSVTFGRCFLDAGWRLHETLVWVKDSLVLGRSDYHYRHEPILYGETERVGYDDGHEPVMYGYVPGGEGRRGRGGECWYGDNKQTTVIEVPRPKANRQHPTMKPVELIERCLVNSTLPEHIVYEPFGGSGSTLIACENLNRRARLIELDPRYCDVIVDRWERHTGQTAHVEEADGSST